MSMPSDDAREARILETMRVCGVDRFEAEFIYAIEHGEITGDLIASNDDGHPATGPGIEPTDPRPPSEPGPPPAGPA